MVWTEVMAVALDVYDAFMLTTVAAMKTEIIIFRYKHISV